MEHNVISFDLVKINKGKEKICKCKNPHYELDVVNRLVMCDDCGAILDPFDALYSLAERMKEVEDLQHKMIDKASTYTKMANEEFGRMIKNRRFREMDNNYKRGLFPFCPNCNTKIDPLKITEWGISN